MIGTPLSKINVPAQSLYNGVQGGYLKRFSKKWDLWNGNIDLCYKLGSLTLNSVAAQNANTIRIMGSFNHSYGLNSVFDIAFNQCEYQVKFFGYGLFDDLGFDFGYKDGDLYFRLNPKNLSSQRRMSVSFIVFGCLPINLKDSFEEVDIPEGAAWMSNSNSVYDLSKLDSSFKIDSKYTTSTNLSSSQESSLETNSSQNMQNTDNQNLKSGGVIDALSFVMLLLSLNPQKERRSA